VRVTPDQQRRGPHVRAIGTGGFVVFEERYPALLMTVSDVRTWTPPPLAELDEAALAFVLDPSPEFILLGTGDTLARPPRALVTALEARGTGIEPMDSRAAARAWGVLRSEDRQVAMALYPLS
jgi:uncharacterized protein